MAQDVHNKLATYRSKRDFQKTREPRGDEPAKRAQQLAFVVHKHDASHLHYDLRLEVHGVMKSWAVPKGPSFDPKVKRLAVEVEDHPVSYNTFEGTIPEGEYGGGTVMLWDEGTYTVNDVPNGEKPEETMEDRISQGKVSITFHGKRLRGAFKLLRTASRGRSKPQWLLIKQNDEFADATFDPVRDEQHSVRSKKSMQDLKQGKTPVETKAEPELRPMLVSTAEELPIGDNWVYEQKLDGVRVLAFIDQQDVALISRLGKDKTKQFPEFVAPLKKLADAMDGPLILDGEITAIDTEGKPLGFQAMMGRIHLDDAAAVRAEIKATPLKFFVFDILLAGGQSLVAETWEQRHKVLEALFKGSKNSLLRLVPTSTDAEAMRKKSDQEGWEGLIIKDRESIYQPGVRSRSWWKWRTLRREEFIVGGWTDPKGTRTLIGSLLLGYYDAQGKLQYAGHAGSGFDRESLAKVHKILKQREQKQSPFATKIATNSKAHWVKPEVVAEIKFKEWTQDKKLRMGIFLGLRDDKRAEDIQMTSTEPQAVSSLQQAIAAMPKSGGLLPVEHGELSLSHLDKVFFPQPVITKRAVLEYYASMMDLILPWMKDRPLVLKRYPEGVAQKGFYQQEPDAKAPGRIERLDTEQGHERRLIGGEAITLLYLAQIGAISYDPWHARVGSLSYPDYSIIDLDPGPDTPFSTVRKVASACLEVLDDVGISGAMKTSGATGIHIYLPLPPQTSWETSLVIAELVCTLAHQEVPRLSTLERIVRKRPKGSVLLDSGQNYLTRSVAGVWSLRAEPLATVSTPITAQDLEDGVEPADFTIATPLRGRRDLWENPMANPIAIEKLLSAAP